jgi:calcineurin-like phosphoesterase family protein
MNTWVYSDPHWDHHNILRFCDRPFKDIKEMQDVMIDRFNSVIRDGDEVWCFGDFSMNEKTVPAILPRIRAKQFLVLGNHDRAHPVHGKKSEAAKQRYLQYGFAGVYQELQNWFGFTVNHLPYLGSEAGAHGVKFAQYRPVDKGGWLLNGHEHSKPEDKVKVRRIDCGVDAWGYRLIHIDELIAIRDKQNLIVKTNSQ